MSEQNLLRTFEVELRRSAGDIQAQLLSLEE